MFENSINPKLHIREVLARSVPPPCPDPLWGSFTSGDLYYIQSVETFRMIVGFLANIPLAMIVNSLFFHPEFYEYNDLGELLYPIIGIPILIFNFWAWIYPEIIVFYFFGKEHLRGEDSFIEPLVCEIKHSLTVFIFYALLFPYFHLGLR